MYIPLHLRLTACYALIVGLAFGFFGTTVYTQAEIRARHDLDDTVKRRGADVRFAKSLYATDTCTSQTPGLLQSVESLGTGGVAIEVFDISGNQPCLILTTTQDVTPNDYAQSGVANLGSSPVPWAPQALQDVIRHPDTSTANDNYSDVTYQGQHVRVYTLHSLDSSHVIQTARSTKDIEQSLSDLRSLLLRGAALVIILASLGGWLISWGMLTAIRRMTRAAQLISTSRDFSKRVQSSARILGKDELTTLASTFNQMLASLEEAYQRQQRFVADASHELRAPITSIRCNLDLLAKAPDLPPAELHGALADTRAEAERMGRLVSDLLLLAHADSAKCATSTTSTNGTPPPAEPLSNRPGQVVDLDSLLLDVFRQYRPLQEHGQDGMDLLGPHLVLQHIAPAKVRGDADQLKQALVALVDNALKYTPHEGQVSLALTVAVDTAIVRVSDTGIGIAPEDLPHIFERFYRADRARTRDRGGSGLGLAIAQSIMQEHQGSIEVVAHTPGKGSTFLLKGPVVT